MTGVQQDREGRPRSSQSAHRVEVIGHRGAPREATENTMASFQRALDAGADAIELDVHGSSDGVIVVHHDPHVAAASALGIAGRPIAELSSAEIRAASGRQGDALLPHLGEVLEMVGDRARVYVEIKGSGIERAVIACIRESGATCAVHSFDHRVSATVRSLAPDMRTGILLESRLADPAAALRAAMARDYWQHWERVDADLVSAVHAAGGRVIAWTVNDTREAERLVDMGVDALCTDLPALMRQLGAAA